MRIQHNITALNAANRLKANENTVSKNIQKLSSGYRINSAADDAAGLAVSEKMRKQINGLSQAEDNTQNGISLIQTAEGGLNETSAILQRMNTLAVEASNGTYRVNDRQNLQLEVNSLNTEVSRIASSTKFNEISLLNGDLSSTGSAGAATATIAGAVTNVAAAVAEKTKTGALTALSSNTTYTITYQDAEGKTQHASVKLTYSSTEKTITGDNNYSTGSASAPTDVTTATALAGALNYGSTDLTKAFKITVDADTKSLDFESKTGGTNKEHIISFQEAGVDLAGTGVISPAAADAYTQATVGTAYDGSNPSAVFTVNGQKFAFVKSGSDTSALGSDVNIVLTNGVNASTTASGTGVANETDEMAKLISSKTGLTVTQDGTAPTKLDFKPGTSSVNGNALVFQVGAENSDDQRASLSIDNMNAASLGLTAIDISDQKGAQAAIDIISKASATVSTTRAQLGALQNELEHTANNLGTMSENLTSAESTIRDVDMTDEYVQYSKNQILSQAANAMLAQANTQPQNVLSLLKG